MNLSTKGSSVQHETPKQVPGRRNFLVILFDGKNRSPVLSMEKTT
ncbi:hypothetical protein HM1_3022 [Heliomicrobium modesticaldum Ice1]|uniref:Uncharacterized protein n=1 Tax=Heliobacterium modesticaldum (strain ATCC 51547 / Ice1) TaxID=498761 RepID=B0TDK4_HELMI|nr:hypothetical protein HM1_3022 [Heliomicrobium modesticaldum Ice1]